MDSLSDLLAAKGVEFERTGRMRISSKDARRLKLTAPKKRKTKAERATAKQDTESQRRLFVEACNAHGLPEPVPEFPFHEERQWRFDWAWATVALEIDGGAWSGGRHTRGKGFIEDQKKLNEAAILGWKVIRCTPAEVKSGEIFETLRRAMGIEVS